MSVHFEGSDAVNTQVAVVEPDTEMGEYVLTQYALVFDYDEVFYVEGTLAELRQMLNQAMTQVVQMENRTPKVGV